ncbi:YncE family protein [Actinacidiphila acididurans]|uniref:Uncharacterized protein n=1 Tax=Actinacidiphila acididurans TaxID=2784346 RepID=A0ABS2TZZ6_9ACTN|nr:hypothetical protein [Actinacidiphila acididurans]MBM9508924.1 hypothetical protein [Actinacidiphila acididurans]
MRTKPSPTAVAAAVAAGFAACVAGPAAGAQAATGTVPLPIAHYSHMLVDPAHHHLFISSGTGYSSILVTDFSGQTVATIANEPGATGLALSADGGTVYAALANGDAVSAISTGTLTETTRYATGAGTKPTYVAWTSGRIWFGYGGAAQGGIGSIDPGTSPAAVTLRATPESWYSAPMVTATPSGDLVAGEPGQSPVQLATYDVSSGSADVLAPQTYLFDASTLDSFQVTPDGKDVVMASGSPYYHQVYRIADLSADGTYPTTAYPNSVSVSGDGSVAAGVTMSGNEVFVFAPGGSTPLNTYTFSGWLANDGVAFAPDGSELFAVTANAFGDTPSLNIIQSPEAVASTLGLTGPATAKPGQTVTLSGTLGGPSASVGGRTLHVTRTDTADPSGVALPDVTTAADGSFSIGDTLSKQTRGTVTYTVTYDGDVHLTSATASASLTVGR